MKVRVERHCLVEVKLAEAVRRRAAAVWPLEEGWALLEVLERAAVSAGRMSWAFVKGGAGSGSGSGPGSGLGPGSILDFDFGSGFGSAGGSGFEDHHDHSGHATSSSGRPPDGLPGLGLGLGPGPGSCGSCCRPVRGAQGLRRSGCAATVCLLRLMIDQVAFASWA